MINQLTKEAIELLKNLISTLSIDAGIYFDAYIDPVGATGSGNLQVSLFYR